MRRDVNVKECKGIVKTLTEIKDGVSNVHSQYLFSHSGYSDMIEWLVLISWTHENLHEIHIFILKLSNRWVVASFQDEDKCPLHMLQLLSSCHVTFLNFQVNCLSLLSSDSKFTFLLIQGSFSRRPRDPLGRRLQNFLVEDQL